MHNNQDKTDGNRMGAKIREGRFLSKHYFEKTFAELSDQTSINSAHDTRKKKKSPLIKCKIHQNSDGKFSGITQKNSKIKVNNLFSKGFEPDLPLKIHVNTTQVVFTTVRNN